MTRLQNVIRPVGPLIEVVIGSSLLQIQTHQQQGLPIPQPFNGRGMLDTGAAITIINPSVVRQLNLLPLQHITTYTSHGLAIVFVYHVSLTIETLTDPLLIVSSALQDIPDFDCLIGRDILDQVVFTYNSPPGYYTLDLP